MILLCYYVNEIILFQLIIKLLFFNSDNNLNKKSYLQLSYLDYLLNFSFYHSFDEAREKIHYSQLIDATINEIEKTFFILETDLSN